MRKILTFAFIALAAAACTVQELTPEDVQVGNTLSVSGSNIPEDDVEKGQIVIYVSDSLSLELEKMTDSDGMVRIAATKASVTGATSLTRLFPDAGEYEPRTRAEGMHRWYVAKYDDNFPATKAAGEFALVKGVEKIEYVPRVKIIGDPQVIGYVDGSGNGDAALSASSSLPFDDPNLSRQWDFYNNGSLPSSASGCDVNVFPVWKKYTTGNKDVVVSVVDTGIDFDHEDLAANMWSNPEKSDDFKYGYNVVTGSYQINPGDHGTHVAGTIAAVNNNGKGVCGIAGGDAKKKVGGVRLMSCQMFDGDKSGNGAQAIKWGADHGAVISQNSWGTTNQCSTQEYLKEAVDYFIKYAGCDNSGKQLSTSPMKGGIVIFAAGNDNSSLPYGVDYNKMVIVTSVGADYRKAYYSNYGSWAHIAAPGGDAKKGNVILSTLPDNQYGLMQGTSMACPHVSGVAALIVSKLGGQGFTCETLRKKLLENVTDITPFTEGTYMGTGLVNAYLAMAASGGKAPETPTNFKAEALSNNVNISVTIPKDEDDGIPGTILVYYSTEPIKKVDGLPFSQFYTDDMKEGDTLTGSITGLEFNTTYYMVARARDLAANVSGLSNQVTVRTGSNMPPKLKAVGGSTKLVIKPHEISSVDFEIENPANHFYEIALRTDVEVGISLDTLVRSCPKVQVSGPFVESGSYKARLVVKDIYDDGDSVDVDITVLENHPPKVVKTFEDILFNSRADDAISFNSSDYFADDDGESLDYQISIDSDAANFVHQNSKFILTPMEYGYATVTVKATDVRKAEASQSFRVLVRNSSSEVDVYPNPVRDFLYVRTSSSCSATLKVISSLGGTFFNQTLDVSPFSPAKVDMSSATPGTYTVLLEINGKSLKYNIVKI